MGRCLSCNEALTDKEMCRKSVISGEYVELCDICFSDISDEVPTMDSNQSWDDDVEDVTWDL